MLLQQFKAGSEKAFRALFYAYRDRLFHYISRFVRSDQVAEELVMDVFMKIWMGKEMVIGIDNFDAFLFRIARNKSIDFLRAAARDSRFKELLWEKIEIASGDRADTALLTHEYEEKLRQALSLLPPQCAKVYHLSREQGFTHDQIAEQLGISKSTVNNHIAGAQRVIRNYLSKNMELNLFILFAASL